MLEADVSSARIVKQLIADAKNLLTKLVEPIARNQPENKKREYDQSRGGFEDSDQNADGHHSSSFRVSPLDVSLLDSLPESIASSSSVTRPASLSLVPWWSFLSLNYCPID